MKTIDGRKAEITSPGKRFPNYGDFAVKHGYPDASTKTLQRDTRQKPQEGDIVTSLTSGAHLTDYRGDTLWIVEATNGERHIFNEKGLRILSEESVTVLADESLGGVMREYTEVNREAAVGERIKIIAAWGTHGKYVNGDELIVDSITHACGVNVDAVKSPPNENNPNGYISDDEYVVLAPTDIVVIEEQRYRLVERKANVGERILSLKTECDTHEGGVYDVMELDNEDDPHYVDDVGDRWHMNGTSEYRVLESVELAKSAPTPTDTTAQQIEGLTDAVAKLTLKVAENERRIAELVEAARPNIDRIAKGLAKLARGEVSGTLAVSNPDQRTRDSIIERAKRDVAELALNDKYNEYRREVSGKEGPFYLSDIYGTYAEFIINKEKRTVVCLLRGVHTHDVLNRGIARCAPDECFNVYLGKAIALRRALGLEVPVEYVKAPAPKSVRVGDIVTGTRNHNFYSVDKRFTLTKDRGDGSFKYAERPTDWIYHSNIGRIIDDSREGTEVAE